MAHKVLNKWQLDYLKNKRILMTFLTVYKYCPQASKALNRYMSIYDKLKNNSYPEITAIYDDPSAPYQAYAQKRHLGHLPIKYFMKMRSFLNREEIIGQLRKSLDELMSFGLYYYDIHNKNILWNGQKIKLVDIDSVIIDDEREFYSVYYNLVDFILELYFYYANPPREYYLPTFLFQLYDSKVFSAEFMEYLDVVYESMDYKAMLQIDAFLEELKEKDKVNYVIKNYISK